MSRPSKSDVFVAPGTSNTDVAPGNPKGEALRRQLGLSDAVGIGLGAIIGAGIFVVTGVAARITGPSLVASLALAAIAATFNALSSAQLAARFPQSGGTYEYGYQLLGPWRGYIAGWMFLASKIAAAGVVALGLGAYANILVPALNPRILAIAAVISFTVLNYFGVRRTSRVNLGIVALSVSSLLLLVIFAAPAFKLSHFRPFMPAGVEGALEAAAILFFAYTGYARIATLGEEVHDPRKTIPRAISITMLCASGLYVAVALASIGVIGAEGMAGSSAPLAAAASSAGGTMLARIIAVGAVAAMLGVILSQIMGLSRMAFAMGRRGDLPVMLSAVHPKYGVPHRAVIVVGLAATVIAATGSLASVAATASFAILAYYGIANWAALRLAPADRLYTPLVPAAGLVVCVILALALSRSVILGGLALLAVGIVVRVVMRSIRHGHEISPSAP